MSPLILRILLAERRGSAYCGADENGLTSTVVYPGHANWLRPYKMAMEVLRYDDRGHRNLAYFINQRLKDLERVCDVSYRD